MTCSITVDDGVSPAVVMDRVPELDIAFGTVTGGATILRFLDGSSKKQHRWRKETYTITGSDKCPSGLRSLDYSQTLTITVDTGLGTDVYMAHSLGPEESWGLKSAEVGWSLVAEAA